MAASERLTRRLARARGPREADRISAKRRGVDERFDPRKSLAATGRYLKLAMDEFGREDLAVVSYHMGIGNLQSVLGAYGDDDASYAQVFFDTAPDQHPRAYRLLAGLGDDSKTYLWRVLASHEVMRLYRDDRARLERLARLHDGRAVGRAGAAPTRPHQGLRDRGRPDGRLSRGRAAPVPDEPAQRAAPRPGAAKRALGGLRPRPSSSRCTWPAACDGLGHEGAADRHALVRRRRRRCTHGLRVRRSAAATAAARRPRPSSTCSTASRR